MEKTPPPEFLTAQEVSSRLRIKLATVYQAVADGRLPCIKLWQGRKKALIRFRAADIEALLLQRTFPAKQLHSREEGKS